MRLPARVDRRFRYLWGLEWLNVPLLTGAVWLVAQVFPLGWLTALGVGLVDLILIQGGLYWYAKHRALLGRPVLSDKRFARLFRAFERINVVAIAAIPVVAGVGVLVRGLPPRADLWAGAGFYLFGVLEHVNYFHRQLMYDNPADVRWLLRNRRLKRARLRADLAAGRL